MPVALGERIAQMRRAQGVTQEELARHMGVSKAAVSKWESGRSLPDVVLLPVLAAYFRLTLDELLDYRALLPREELRRAHARLTELFATGQAQAAMKEIRAMERIYYADADVLIECATLRVNHMDEKETLEEALALLERARKIGSLYQGRQAVYLHAACLLALGRAQEAAEEMEAFTQTPMEEDLMLAQAYVQSGRAEEAAAQGQWAAYKAVLSLVSALGFLAGADDARTTFLRLRTLEKTFSLSTVHPISLLSAYALCAMACMKAQDTHGALDALAEYVRVAQEAMQSGILLRAVPPFEKIGARLQSLPLGEMPPVSGKVACERIAKCVLENPAFAPLKGEKRYETLKCTLADALRRAQAERING